MHLTDTPELFAETLDFFFTSTVRDVRQEHARVAVVVAVRVFFGDRRLVISLRGE